MSKNSSSINKILCSLLIFIALYSVVLLSWDSIVTQYKGPKIYHWRSSFPIQSLFCSHPHWISTIKISCAKWHEKSCIWYSKVTTYFTLLQFYGPQTDPSGVSGTLSNQFWPNNNTPQVRGLGPIQHSQLHALPTIANQLLPRAKVTQNHTKIFPQKVYFYQ